MRALDPNLPARFSWTIPDWGFGHHTLVKSPDGRHLDVTGWTSAQQLSKRYGAKKHGYSITEAPPRVVIGDNLDIVVGNIAGDKPGRVHMNPTESQVEDIARDVTGYVPEKGLFQTITIVDEVPSNMAYIANSAIPPATFDAAANTLTWRFGVTPAADPLRMTYRLRPLEIGTWPTNVRADASYRDALGNDGTIVFPVPEVEVYGLDHRVYLPLALRTGCLIKRRPLDVALVLDASSSMTEPSATGSGTKLDAARAAARAFIDLVDPDDRVAIVSFNKEATLHAPLTNDAAQLGAALDAITAEVGTRIDLGLVAGDRALDARRATALPVLILLTDGLQNAPPGDAPVVTAADALKVGNAVVYTIGLGATIDQTLLRQVASSPEAIGRSSAARTRASPARSDSGTGSSSHPTPSPSSARPSAIADSTS